MDIYIKAAFKCTKCTAFGVAEIDCMLGLLAAADVHGCYSIESISPSVEAHVEQEKRGRWCKDRQGAVLPAGAVALKARWDARRVWKGASLALPSLAPLLVLRPLSGKDLIFLCNSLLKIL